MRIELAQIRKYSPSDDIVNEIIYFVYDIIPQYRSSSQSKKPVFADNSGKYDDTVIGRRAKLW